MNKLAILLFVSMMVFPSFSFSKIVKMLAIGGSFSEDAIEQNLYELAEVEGLQVIIGNLYNGGCTLDQHVEYIQNNANVYQYRKIGLDGIKYTTKNVTMREVLEDESWDYISVQQNSGDSGLYETYKSLSQLVDYIKDCTPNDPKIIFHQTWAYAQNATHAEFLKYDCDQLNMYRSIVNTVKLALENNEINIVVPSGTAIQNARTSFIGDNMTRDGYHLELLYGRYTAACT